jgi:hypothetical protein
MESTRSSSYLATAASCEAEMKQWGRSLALRSTRAMSIGAQAPWASLAKRICALLAPSIGNPVWLDSYLRSPSGPKIWLVLVPVLYLLVSAYMYSRQTHKVRLDSLFQADKPSPVRLLEQLLRPLLRHHHDPILSRRVQGAVIPNILSPDTSGLASAMMCSLASSWTLM